MRSSTNALIMIVLGTILLPVLGYFIYTISAVKEEEKVLEKVYQNQLDAILFSANQYSDNVINSTLDKLEKRLDTNLSITGEDRTFLDFSTISGLLLLDNENGKQITFALAPELNYSDCNLTLQSVITQDSVLVGQLIRYKKAGYRKVQPARMIEIGDQMYQAILAVLDGPQGNTITCALLLSPTTFVNDVLSPRFQQMAAEELIISVGTKLEPTLIYTSDTLSGLVNLTKPMWIFPGLEVGVSPKGQSVSAIIKGRTRSNLLAAGLIISLLFFGFWLILRNLRKEMRLAQTKSDFVSNVSHELRTPLSLISMFAETLLLERYKTAEKRKEYENIIVKESARLTNIVNKILNFSQIEANKRKYHFAEAELNALVTELIHDYSYHMESNGFSYEVSLTEGDTLLSIDREAVYEALVNLIDNAMKYSPDQKHLQIRTEQRSDGVSVSVTDHGMGIAPSQIKQIFDKFYRVTEGNIQTTRGAGLGLSLVKHIVDAHGGTIEVDSEPGKGSTFRLIFRLKQTHA